MYYSDLAADFEREMNHPGNQHYYRENPALWKEHLRCLSSLKEKAAEMEENDNPARLYAEIAEDDLVLLAIIDTPKMLRETLCLAQQYIPQDDHRRNEHIERLGRLIAECDRHRPLGLDGKHGNRHTHTCGCDR